MDNKNYIEKMVQLRHEKGLTQAELADKLDFSEQMIIMLELGEIVPNAAQLEKIMEFVIGGIA